MMSSVLIVDVVPLLLRRRATFLDSLIMKIDYLRGTRITQSVFFLKAREMRLSVLWREGLMTSLLQEQALTGVSIFLRVLMTQNM